MTYLASRYANYGTAYYGYFYARAISSTGSLTTSYLGYMQYTGENRGNNYSSASRARLAPVVTLKKGIEVDTAGSGNGSQNNPYKLITSSTIGAYVDYDAGAWTEEHLQLIEASEGNPTVNTSDNNPTKQGEFGGFTIKQSRNSNSTEADEFSSYKPKTSGWRIWDINEDTGEITIIHAGHPELYYITSDNSSTNLNILEKRNLSMYENNFAETGSAHFLTYQDTQDFLNKQKVSYSPGTEPFTMFENGSYCLLATATDSSKLYHISPITHSYDSNSYEGPVRCTCISYSKIWSTNR